MDICARMQSRAVMYKTLYKCRPAPSAAGESNLGVLRRTRTARVELEPDLTFAIDGHSIKMLRRPPTAISARPSDVARIQALLDAKPHPRDERPPDGETSARPKNRDELLAVEEEERRVREARTRDERIGL